MRTSKSLCLVRPMSFPSRRSLAPTVATLMLGLLGQCPMWLESLSITLVFKKTVRVDPW
uniref:Uncharacterized protein n=1 Tax=Brassica campestris TaxID=3711 RepID=A0A3P6CQ57_BRACM|nr:unnamed protein product [Brassica rapa]